MFTFTSALRWLGLSLLEHFEALLDDRQGLYQIALQADEHVRGVLVGPAHGLVRFRLRPVEHLLCPRFRLAQDGLVLQQQRRLLLRRADDLLRFLAQRADDTAGIGATPRRSPSRARESRRAGRRADACAAPAPPRSRRAQAQDAAWGARASLRGPGYPRTAGRRKRDRTVRRHR